MNEYYKTSGFYLAAFLYTKGLELVSIDKISHPGRSNFVFVDSPERETFVQAFNFAKENDQGVMVDARQITMATKLLKEKLYQEK